MTVTMTLCHFRQVRTFAGVALHAHAEVGSEPDVRRMAAMALLAAGMQYGRVQRMRSERVPLPFSSRSGGRKEAQTDGHDSLWAPERCFSSLVLRFCRYTPLHAHRRRLSEPAPDVRGICYGGGW
jgi:hypothetical protein